MNLKITALTTTIALTMATSAWSDVSIDKKNVQTFYGMLKYLEEEIKIDSSNIQGFEGVAHSPCGDIESTVYCPANATIYVELNQMSNYIDTYGENSFYLEQQESSHCTCTQVSALDELRVSRVA